MNLVYETRSHPTSDTYRILPNDEIIGKGLVVQVPPKNAGLLLRSFWRLIGDRTIRHLGERPESQINRQTVTLYATFHSNDFSRFSLLQPPSDDLSYLQTY